MKKAKSKIGLRLPITCLCCGKEKLVYPYQIKLLKYCSRRCASKASRGRIVSKETRDKISKSGTGKIVSKETRDKISKSQKGGTKKTKGKTWEEIMGEEKAAIYREHQKEVHKGQIPPQKGLTYEEYYGEEFAKELKQKSSDSHPQGFIKNPDFDMNQIVYCGCKCGETVVIKKQHRIYGIPIYKLGHSVRDPKILNRIRAKRLKQVIPTKDTEPERILQEALRKFIEIETHYPIKGQPDIKIGNVLIFVDGDYYHAHPDRYKPEAKMLGGKTAQQVWDKDKRVTDYLINKGYKVLRFWEQDIHNNLEECVIKIKGML
jgi:DNA mismatch endonuclease (patch repair protein)